MSLPAYYTTKDKVWHYAFRVICFAIFFFLLAPILIIDPAQLQCAALLHLHP